MDAYEAKAVNTQFHPSENGGCTAAADHQTKRVSDPESDVDRQLPALQVPDSSGSSSGSSTSGGFGSGEEGASDSTVREVGCGAKINNNVRRWSSNFNEGVGKCQRPDVVFMVFKQKFSWMGKYVTLYRIHAMYFLTLGGLGTLVIYGLPLSDSKRLSFVDATFTAFSAACGAGLQTVRSQELTQVHYYVIILLLNLGAPVLISLLPLYARRFYFYLFVKQYKRGLCQPSPCTTDSFSSMDLNVAMDLEHCRELEQGLKTHQILTKTPPDPPIPSSFDVVPVELSQSLSQSHTVIVSTEQDSYDRQKPTDECQSKSFETQGHDVGETLRLFVDTKQVVRTLEYRALVALSWMVIFFFLGCHIVGFALGALYFLGSPHDAATVRAMDINPTFFAFYTSVTTFTNAGYNVNNNSMMAFQKSPFLLLLYSALACLGNTMYAPALRLLVWIRYLMVNEKEKVVYEYLLCHPRRCFTNLFPVVQTVWLVVTFFSFTAFQLILLCKLEWTESDALGGMTPIEKLVAGVYQAVGTRNGGGTVVELYRLAPAVLFIFGVMMYISAYPTFLSLQTSSAEVEYDDTELAVSHEYRRREKMKLKPVRDHWESILVVQSRRLLARDTSYLLLAILFLCLSENHSIKRDPLNFSIFNIVFEVISAYGSVGLSLGYHCGLQIDKTHECEEVPYSFSGTWTNTGKLILIAVMFVGRHRGLPDDIDPAIRLPTKLLAPAIPMPETPKRSTCSGSGS